MRTLLVCLTLVTACGGDDAVVTPDATTSSNTGSTSSPTSAPTTGASPSTTTTADASTSTSTSEAGESPSTTDGESTSTSDAFATTTGETSTTTLDPATSTSTTATTGDTPSIPGPKIKVMTFNIRVGTADDGPDAWDNRKGLVYQVFENQDADFIGVQEALRFQVLAIDDNVEGYKRIGVATIDGDTKGPINAIYYRKSRFTVDDSETFWLSDTPNQVGSTSWGNANNPRAVTWGHFVEKTTGYSFYVYNTHFDHISQHSREQSAVLLARKITNRVFDQDPFVVTGDFNATEGNLATKYLKGNAKIDGESTDTPLFDSFRVLYPDADNVGTAHGFNGGTGGNKIDYVYVPAGPSVINAYISHFNVDGRYPSDHFPVIGVVKFPPKD